MTHVDVFMQHRSALFGLAYRMLGSASEAEDVLQDAYLRYAAAPTEQVRSHRAYLNTIVTRLCLDHLKAARTQREQYLGPWLPEPVLTNQPETDPQHQAELHESITQAFLVLLESLTPQERAVFLLHEVFRYEHAEVAAILDLSPAHCRQLFHRAKTHLAKERPRFEPSRKRQHELVESFIAATLHGDLDQLTHLLAEDVAFWADSGGNAPAPTRGVRGRTPVTKLVIGIAKNSMREFGDMAALRSVIAEVNGETAALLWVYDVLDTVAVYSFTGEQINAIWLIRNPEKLGFIQRQLQIRDAGKG
jgi:RNA polymerase sigma-70 factor, ECF subfamily